MIPLSCYFKILNNNFSDNYVLIAIIVIALIILIALSAFFSSSETAYSSVNQIRIRSYVEDNVKGSRKALWIIDNFDKALTTILVGNNFVNIASTTLAAVLFNVIIPSNQVLANILNTIIMTILILIFGEILPKCLAKRSAETKCLKYAGSLYFLIKILTPVVFIFLKIKILFDNDEHTEQITTTSEELDDIIDTMVDEGEIDDDDAELMHGMIDTNTKTVYDIMVPRVDVVAVEVNDSIDEIKEVFFENKYSRIPVYEEDKDHIIGILSERDFFTKLLKDEEVIISSIINEPIFVNKEMKVDELIRKMQEEKKHFAVVTDEYGGTAGIVTMEDAIEVITGEIYDEHDEVEDIVEDIKQIDENHYILDSELLLEDLFEKFDLENVPDTPYSNIGGYLYSLASELPIVDSTYTIDAIKYKEDEKGMTNPYLVKLTFTILEVVDRRIMKVMMEIGEEVLLENQKTEND